MKVLGNLSQDATMVYYGENETVEGADSPKSLEPGLKRLVVWPI